MLLLSKRWHQGESLEITRSSEGRESVKGTIPDSRVEDICSFGTMGYPSM